MNALRLLPVAAGSLAVVVVGFALVTRKSRKSPDHKERERRERISLGGRITDGTVINVHEVEAAEDHPEAQLIVYQYDVAGVSYECSQDVTWLRHLVDLHSCRLGVPTSVKYDPQNPGNSIVVAENWSGLRK
ncbi:MAG: hypothetical protein ROO76_01235 [Terriglobia bacterium]|jgi:hypothetical protein|nr:hypothetical protein [Terriglobia bacterium]